MIAAAKPDKPSRPGVLRRAFAYGTEPYWLLLLCVACGIVLCVSLLGGPPVYVARASVGAIGSPAAQPPEIVEAVFVEDARIADLQDAVDRLSRNLTPVVAAEKEGISHTPAPIEVAQLPMAPAVRGEIRYEDSPADIDHQSTTPANEPPPGAPPADTAFEPPAVELPMPRVPVPLSVKLRAPKPPPPADDAQADAEAEAPILDRPQYIRGDPVELEIAVDAGDVQAVKWRVGRIDLADDDSVTLLDCTANLKVASDGRSAFFTHRFPGVYRATVAVAGEQSVDLVDLEFEIIDDTEPAGVPVGAAGNRQPAPAHDAQAGGPGVDGAGINFGPPQPTLADVVLALVRENRSPDRVREARLVADALAVTANRLRVGMLALDSDPWSEARQSAALNLGNAVMSWDAFFIAMARVGGPRPSGDFLTEVANLLRRVRE